MASSRLDLPPDAFVRPQWWSSALYKHVPGKGLLFQGYSRPALQTFYDHVGRTQRTGGVWASWVWFGGQWVRVA